MSSYTYNDFCSTADFAHSSQNIFIVVLNISKYIVTKLLPFQQYFLEFWFHQQQCHQQVNNSARAFVLIVFDIHIFDLHCRPITSSRSDCIFQVVLITLHTPILFPMSWHMWSVYHPSYICGFIVLNYHHPHFESFYLYKKLKCHAKLLIIELCIWKFYMSHKVQKYMYDLSCLIELTVQW
jgi:hypothetical protein